MRLPFALSGGGVGGFVRPSSCQKLSDKGNPLSAIVCKSAFTCASMSARTIAVSATSSFFSFLGGWKRKVSSTSMN